jgi:N-acetylmuramoyl-L-alanine amidase
MLLVFYGCASVPRKSAISSYNINGVSYLPLIALCDLKGINWDYDVITRTINLNRDSHRLKLMVGNNVIFIDGTPRELNRPVDIYEGAIVVPYKFREQILDVLFKEGPAAAEPIYFLSEIKKVIIDAGHGGRDPGAIGKSGLKEKEVTLDIAKRLSNLLREQGIEVIMTRSKDTFVSLTKRVAVSNNCQADLFVSIHANASRVRSLNGVEVYYISPDVSDTQRALASARNNEILNLDGSCFLSHSFNLKAILWDMIYNYNRAESIELSRVICKTIGSNLDARLIGVKSANFYVLRGSCTPAVLLEVGFLSNSDEERLLSEASYRQRITEAINQGLQDYGRELALTKQHQKGSLNLTKSQR